MRQNIFKLIFDSCKSSARLNCTIRKLTFCSKAKETRRFRTSKVIKLFILHFPFKGWRDSSWSCCEFESQRQVLNGYFNGIKLFFIDVEIVWVHDLKIVRQNAHQDTKTHLGQNVISKGGNDNLSFVWQISTWKLIGVYIFCFL